MAQRSLALALVFGSLAVAAPPNATAAELKNVVISRFRAQSSELVWHIPDKPGRAKQGWARVTSDCRTTIDKKSAKAADLKHLMVADLTTNAAGELERIEAAALNFSHPLLAEFLAVEERETYLLWAKQGMTYVSNLESGSINTMYLKKGELTAALAESISRLPNLVQLKFYDFRVEKKSFDAFPAHPKLDSITFHRTPMSREAFEWFAKLPSLTSLVLVEGNGLAGRAMEPLSKARKLTRFAAWQSDLTDEGLVPLAACKALTRIEFEQTAVTDKGIALFQDHDIGHGSFWGAKITDRSVDVMLKWPHFGFTTVHQTGLTGDGVLRLLKHPKLMELWIDTNLPQNVLDRVRNEFLGSELHFSTGGSRVFDHIRVTNEDGTTSITESGNPSSTMGATPPGRPGATKPAQSASQPGTTRPGSAAPGRVGPKPNF